MKKIFSFFFFFFLVIPNTFALSVAIDMDSNRILYQNNSNTKSLIASTTNIMTT